MAARIAAGAGVLVLGGGSNLVVADRGIDVPIVRIGVRGIRIDREPDGASTVTVGAGEIWDDVVAELTADGLGELATLSGIPGSTGATPVQNVGAYGTEIADVLTSVTIYDRRTGAIRAVPAAELRLAYRSSTLRGTDRAVVTDVTMRLTDRPVTVRYAELARALGVEPGGSAPAARGAAGGARPAPGQGHGAGPGRSGHLQRRLLLHQPDPGRRAGGGGGRGDSGRARPRRDVPALPGRRSDETRPIKLSAAWLIERAGFPKGYQGRAAGSRYRASTPWR